MIPSANKLGASASKINRVSINLLEKTGRLKISGPIPNAAKYEESKDQYHKLINGIDTANPKIDNTIFIDA